jgi:hypothetical protein
MKVLIEIPLENIDQLMGMLKVTQAIAERLIGITKANQPIPSELSGANAALTVRALIGLPMDLRSICVDYKEPVPQAQAVPDNLIEAQKKALGIEQPESNVVPLPIAEIIPMPVKARRGILRKVATRPTP